MTIEPAKFPLKTKFLADSIGIMVSLSSKSKS